MNKERKAAVVEELAGQISDAQAIFVVDYRGVSVPQAAELRDRLTEAGATVRVVKNTLTERAADKAGTQRLKELLDGPTAFTFVSGDAALAAKALWQFRRQNEVLEFKGGEMDGTVLTIEQIESLARLPGQEALRGQLVGIMASPITGLVRGLGSLIGGLAVALGQVQEKGALGEPEESPAEEPAGSPEQAQEDSPASEAPGDPVAEAEAAEEESTEAPGEEQDAEEAEPPGGENEEG